MCDSASLMRLHNIARRKRTSCEGCQLWCGHARIGPTASGRVNQKVEPRPGALSTPTCPWCCSTIALAMANPSPSPLSGPRWSRRGYLIKPLPHLLLLLQRQSWSLVTHRHPRAVLRLPRRAPYITWSTGAYLRALVR